MLREWLAGLRPAKTGSAGWYMSGSSVASALVVPGATPDAPTQIDYLCDIVEDPSESVPTLARQSAALGLKRVGGTLVLSPEVYNFTLIERPDVADAELHSAVRWQLAEQLEFPAEEATFDTFALPSSASQKRPMLFVAVARTSALADLLSQLDATGLCVEQIDVLEMALRNISAILYPESDQAVAVLRMTPGSGVINISRGNELFLSRRLAAVPNQLSDAAWEGYQDRLLLQVQRSIDYYESALGQPPCDALLVAVTHGWQERVAEYLAEVLSLGVRSMPGDLAAQHQVSRGGETDDPFTAAVVGLPAVGGALRGQLLAAAT